MTEDSANQASAGRDMFVSYASQDVAIADSVVENLEKNGIWCWIAPRDVRPGAQYADAIVRAISESKTLVLVLSTSAVASSHVGKEVERASSKHKQIIALRIDAAPLTPALEYFLSESQWIDVPALGMPAALTKIANAVRDGSGSSNPMPAADVAGRVISKRSVRVAMALVVLGAAVMLAARFWPSRHQEVPAVAAISDKSIAVLPFADMSQKKDQEYFGDGMAEEILDLLAKIPGLTVIGRTSSFQFKGKNEDLRKIGTELNAAYVLEGSVRNSGDQVRITAQLINTKTGAHEWSETYDRPIGDVLKLQDAIAAAVVRELQLTVAPEFFEVRSTLRDKDAYDLMLRGRHAIDRFDKEGTEEGVALFQQAFDRDPKSAEAAFWLASVYAEQGEMGFLPPTAAFERARRTLGMAFDLGAKSAAAHELLGEIHTIYDWDWAAADWEFRQSAELAPGSADALYGKALLSFALGHWDDALSHIKSALVRDPMDPVTFTVLSWIQLRRGHLEEAEAAARRVLDISPTYGWAHYNIGIILLARGQREASLFEMQQDSIDAAVQQGLAIAYYASGTTAESDAVLTRMLKDKEQVDHNAFGIAEVYAFRGQADEAMHWLERAYDQKDASLYYIKGELSLKSLEADPRYKGFLKKMNLPE